MADVIRSIRLKGFLESDINRSSGFTNEIIYDQTNQTLRILNGVDRGGIATLANTSFVSTQIDNLVNGAPSNLNTLGDLALAINNDPAFYTTITNYVNNAVSNISSFVTSLQLATTLSSYATTSSLSSLVSNSQLATTLSSYATTSMLNPLVTNAALSLTLTSYAPKFNPSFTGSITAGTGIINIGSGQLYKDVLGNVGINTIPSGNYLLEVNGAINATSVKINGINTATTGKAIAMSIIFGG